MGGAGAGLVGRTWGRAGGQAVGGRWVALVESIYRAFLKLVMLCVACVCCPKPLTSQTDDYGVPAATLGSIGLFFLSVLHVCVTGLVLLSYYHLKVGRTESGVNAGGTVY